MAAFSLTLNPSPAGRGKQPLALAEIRQSLRLIPPQVSPSGGERSSLSQRERAGVRENAPANL